MEEGSLDIVALGLDARLQETVDSLKLKILFCIICVILCIDAGLPKVIDYLIGSLNLPESHVRLEEHHRPQLHVFMGTATVLRPI